ncbi:MAG: FHA domain-containing protein [Actinomycetota bacterium]|nr:FHA domain-containing protein [Actinomycetota bacterium]MDQ3647786.1 FHA domain-containing protein [Actinomycetota bacterium]
MEGFTAGTLAGSGSFRCGRCGFAIALHERDTVPECPSCGHSRFARASLFGPSPDARGAQLSTETPGWLENARDALTTSGDYLAFDDGDRVHVVPLQEGWTRIGRSPSAHVRFDDPTVSRRHAMLYRDATQARVLDDRSLNGVFRNGSRVDLAALRDGDEIAVGRFRLHFLKVAAERSAAEVGSALG